MYHFKNSKTNSLTYQHIDYTIAASVNGRPVSKDQLDHWMKKRIRYNERKLHLPAAPNGNADDMLAELTRQKLQLGPKRIYQILAKQIALCNRLTAVMVRLSKGKTKNCITEVDVHGVPLSLFLSEFDRLQSENSKENLAINLGVAPDHYFLGVTKDEQFEVIETCGNNPLPSRFYITYGNTEGLNTIRESEQYPSEAAGAARLKSGLIEGGVRHQFKETSDGFHAKLLVEFPSAAPNSLIRAHQMHLACEFSHWIRAIADYSK